MWLCTLNGKASTSRRNRGQSQVYPSELYSSVQLILRLLCQALGNVGSVLELVGPVSVYPATSVWQHINLPEQTSPWDYYVMLLGQWGLRIICACCGQQAQRNQLCSTIWRAWSKLLNPNRGNASISKQMGSVWQCSLRKSRLHLYLQQMICWISEALVNL